MIYKKRSQTEWVEFDVDFLEVVHYFQEIMKTRKATF